MVVTSPRATFRGLRSVPLQFRDPDLLLIAQAINQIQERLRSHPVLSGAPTAAAYTMGDEELAVLADATSNAVTVTLPSAKGRLMRQAYVKKTDTSSNTVTVAAASGETIDGKASHELQGQYACLGMVSDGTNWMILSQVGYTTGL